MARQIHLQPHLSVDELERRYRAAKEPSERSWWQILWLLVQRHTATEVAAVTSYSAYWIGQIAKHYNTEGPAGMHNRRHDATSPLHVRVYVMPTTPRVGVVTQLVIDVADAHDRAAISGSWAQLEVHWDMASMHMTVPSVVVAGDQRVAEAGPVFVVALLPSMAGAWRATMTLRTPGRPTWQGVLEFGVLSG